MGEWVDLGSKIGCVGLLLIFVYGLRQRWWVMGQEYEEMKAQRDYEREEKKLATDLADEGAKEVTKRGSATARPGRNPNA